MAPSSTEKRSKIAPLKMITRDMVTSRCRCAKPRVSKANAKAETVHEAARGDVKGLQTDSTLNVRYASGSCWKGSEFLRMVAAEERWLGRCCVVRVW